jgi:hypothetical protein
MATKNWRVVIQIETGALMKDALVLLRCLVFHQLQPHHGQYVSIRQV